MVVPDGSGGNICTAGRHMSLSTRCYPDNVIEIYDWQKYRTSRQSNSNNSRRGASRRRGNSIHNSCEKTQHWLQWGRRKRGEMRSRARELTATVAGISHCDCYSLPATRSHSRACYALLPTPSAPSLSATPSSTAPTPPFFRLVRSEKLQ